MKTNPLLVEVPESFETERLLVRAPRPGDGARVNAAIIESGEALKAWLPWMQTPPKVEETEAKMRECASRWLARTDLTMLLFRKEDGEVVGGTGLHRMDWDVRRFEIGYWGRTRFGGQGYVGEACRGIACLAFDVLAAQRVEIRCDTRNERSRRVAERSGFELEGILRSEALGVDGNIRDTCVYSLIAAERGRLDAPPGR